jgi:hypothetical protein
MSTDLLAGVDGPSSDDLAAITDEWPLIAAELDLVDAEIRVLTVDRPSDLDWRRLRRAEARVCRALTAYLSDSPDRAAGLAA